ncbi:MAG TPA: DUF929 family protein [Nitrososphaerales archaeon]|nr:DUF929 family protein [Nitrososphaerales archaeon]
MRARVRKRQLYRRVTITGVVVGILVLLIVGFYFAYQTSNVFAQYNNERVSQSDLATLRQLSQPPYGPPSSSMVSMVKAYNGVPFTVNGKPLVVYIGADYCQFCAAQRWSLVLTLMRFGNITGLEYMSSSPGEGDYATFTFENASYASPYFVFQGFEMQNRNGQPLQTVPSNYTAAFAQYQSSFPFLNFGNTRVISGALWPPTALGGDSWTTVYNAIRTGNPLGTQIKAGANVMTALICKLTGNQPSSVCTESPIGTIEISVAYHQPPPLGAVDLAAVPILSPPWAVSPPGEQHK